MKLSMKKGEEIRQNIENIQKKMRSWLLIILTPYSREKSADKEYLSEDLSVLRLFKDFQKQHEDTKISYRFYAKVFKEKFPNLTFHHLSSDTCSTCDLLKAKMRSDPNNKENKLQLELHHRKAKKAMDSMKAYTIKSQGQ